MTAESASITRLETKSDEHARNIVSLWEDSKEIRKLVSDVRVQIAGIVGAFSVLNTIITAIIVHNAR